VVKLLAVLIIFEITHTVVLFFFKEAKVEFLNADDNHA